MANFFFKNNLFTYGGAGSLLLKRLFPSNGEWALLSSCNVWASHCARLSQGMGSRTHRLQELWHVGSGVMAPGFLRVGSSWMRDQTHASCIGKWILYHQAPKEAPG